MKYILLSILTTVSTSVCFANNSLEHIIKLEKGDYQNESVIEIDSIAREKHQAVLKFMSPQGSHSSSKRTETNLVTYEVTPQGVTCHIGWYLDGFIGTALNGTEEGKQCIIVNGSIVGVSYDFKIYKDHFEHKYTWGKVYSYPNHQYMITN